MSHDEASERYEAGDLEGAIAAAASAVKAAPTDTGARGFLCELLCFAGDIERADKHLDLLSDQDSAVAKGVALFRQILRGEAHRRDVFEHGRPPELLAEPPDHAQLALKALAALREGVPADAADLCAQAEAARPAVAGTHEGARFADLRDLDDVTAGLLELITSSGKYYWVPWEHVQTIRFAAPQRPRDLIWREAEIAVRGGPEGVVYIPALYPGTLRHADDAVRLGRATDWPDSGAGPVRGAGLRGYLVDDADVPIMELGTLEIAVPEGSTA